MSVEDNRNGAAEFDIPFPARTSPYLSWVRPRRPGTRQGDRDDLHRTATVISLCANVPPMLDELRLSQHERQTVDVSVRGMEN